MKGNATGEEDYITGSLMTSRENPPGQKGGKARSHHIDFLRKAKASTNDFLRRVRGGEGASNSVSRAFLCPSRKEGGGIMKEKEDQSL